MEGQAGPSSADSIADATSQSMQVTPQPGVAVNAATSSNTDSVKYEDMTSKDYCRDNVISIVLYPNVLTPWLICRR